jgi:hypothetical protein
MGRKWSLPEVWKRNFESARGMLRDEEVDRIRRRAPNPGTSR